MAPVQEPQALPWTTERLRLGRKGEMVEETQSERVQYLDVLRVLSMLAVVAMHTLYGTLRFNYGSAVWHLANVLNSLATASVPLFFMISGALLLSSPKTDSIRFTLRTRLPRVLVPFLVWSLIAVAYYLLISWKVNGVPDWHAAAEALRNLPVRPTAAHLWFMYALIPLYILSPLIKKVTDAAGRNMIIYLLVLWFVASSLLPTLATFLPEPYTTLVTRAVRYSVSTVADYAGYFVLGYYLMMLNRRAPKGLLALAVVASTACIALGTWWKTTSEGAYEGSFSIYPGLFVLVLSCALFLLCKEIVRARRLGVVAGATVRFLAPLAFGIYLAHNLLVNLIGRLTDWIVAESVGAVLAFYVVVLAASTLCIFVVSAVKPLCYVLTGQRYRGLRKRRPG
jgi:surface polysaccharide O-acyltransferase-like enzyme